MHQGGRGENPCSRTRAKPVGLGTCRRRERKQLAHVRSVTRRRPSRAFSRPPANQATSEPRRKIVVSEVATRDGDQHLDDRVVILLQRVPAPLNQQLHEVKGRALVPVREPLIRNHGMDQRRPLVVDEAVVAVVRTRQGRLDHVRVQDPRRAAAAKGGFMPTNGIVQGDAVVPSSDLRAPPLPCVASRTCPG